MLLKQDYLEWDCSQDKLLTTCPCWEHVCVPLPHFLLASGHCWGSDSTQCQLTKSFRASFPWNMPWVAGSQLCQRSPRHSQRDEVCEILQLSQHVSNNLVGRKKSTFNILCQALPYPSLAGQMFFLHSLVSAFWEDRILVLINFSTISLCGLNLLGFLTHCSF